MYVNIDNNACTLLDHHLPYLLKGVHYNYEYKIGYKSEYLIKRENKSVNHRPPSIGPAPQEALRSSWPWVPSATAQQIPWQPLNRQSGEAAAVNRWGLPGSAEAR